MANSENFKTAQLLTTNKKNPHIHKLVDDTNELTKSGKSTVQSFVLP